MRSIGGAELWLLKRAGALACPRTPSAHTPVPDTALDVGRLVYLKILEDLLVFVGACVVRVHNQRLPAVSFFHAMWFTAITVAVGALIGLALGGRPRHLPEHTFHLWPLLLAGLALQVMVEAGIFKSIGVGLSIVSYLLLLAFGALNLRLAGMGVVMVGMVMNLIPIAINGGMPVRPRALADAGIAPSVDRADFVKLRGERHIETDDDRITVMGDIIPIRPLRQVVSFGDLVLSIGIITLIGNLLRPPRDRPW